MKDVLKKIKTYDKRWKDSPIEFFTQALDVEEKYVWGKMAELAEALRDNHKVAAKAGHAVSKSYTAARLALWFLFTHRPSTVITTAPSHTQVEEVLWREIRGAHAKARIPLGGNITKTKLELAEKWFAYGFATKPDTVTQQATRIQGFHNENILVIMDEAAGIMREIWEAVESLLASGNSKLLVIGNPTTASGDFVDCFKSSSFKKITISCLDTPNYKEGKEIIPGLSGRQYVEDVEKKFGKQSNYYKARVLGEIPDEDADSLIPLSWIEKAEGRAPHPYRFKKRFITVDPADGGDDATEIKAWENKTEIDSQTIRGKRIEHYEGDVLRMLRKIGGNTVVVDGDGIGRVLIGLLKGSKDEDVEIIEFMGSSKNPKDPSKFETVYSESHWMMREDFESNEISISIDDEQREEIAGVKLTTHHRGFITVEKKDKLIERIQRSPGKMDCIRMMSWAFGDIKPITTRPDPYVNHDDGGYEDPLTL